MPPPSLSWVQWIKDETGPLLTVNALCSQQYFRTISRCRTSTKILVTLKIGSTNRDSLLKQMEENDRMSNRMTQVHLRKITAMSRPSSSRKKTIQNDPERHQRRNSRTYHWKWFWSGNLHDAWVCFHCEWYAPSTVTVRSLPHTATTTNTRIVESWSIK